MLNSVIIKRVIKNFRQLQYENHQVGVYHELGSRMLKFCEGKKLTYDAAGWLRNTEVANNAGWFETTVKRRATSSFFHVIRCFDRGERQPQCSGACRWLFGRGEEACKSEHVCRSCVELARMFMAGQAAKLWVAYKMTLVVYWLLPILANCG